jgi:dTDP-4-dehydrorhamnose reductase
MKILVLGGSGMLGHRLVQTLAATGLHDVHATVRSASVKRQFDAALANNIHAGVDVLDDNALLGTVAMVRPEVIVNCVGLVKQFAEANDPLAALPINSLLPHRLARIADVGGARLVHISTDCVFDGAKGNYSEQDASDAKDLYGRSKYLGEVTSGNAITLRTSIIGHDLQGATEGLVEWFLAQEGSVRGFTNAIFSGFTTDELSRIIADVVLPQRELSGLYQASADPISKFDLLTLVKKVYGKTIDIVADGKLVIDRSLDSSRFRSATGYVPPSWNDMLERMHQNARSS